MKNNWKQILNSLRQIYQRYDIVNFEKDEAYLKKAFEFTEALWEKQFNKINELKVVMLSEAPLFGEKQTYLYNPNSKPTAFFYFQDLQAFPTFNNIDISPKFSHHKKILMFEHFIKNDFLILDIFPFALNSKDTAINYKKMSKKLYNDLLLSTAESYLIPKLNYCLKKMSHTPCFIYRYKRLFSKTGNHMDHILSALYHGGKNYILNTVNGTNMSLDRKKLSDLFE